MLARVVRLKKRRLCKKKKASCPLYCYQPNVVHYACRQIRNFSINSKMHVSETKNTHSNETLLYISIPDIRVRKN